MMSHRSSENLQTTPASRMSSSDLLIGDLQELQHHAVSSHVPQQPLLLLLGLLPGAALLDTQLTEAQQDLETDRRREDRHRGQLRRTHTHLRDTHTSLTTL